MKTAGLDPVAVLKELGSRASLVHIKDGPATIEAPMAAVGSGTLDWHRIIPAAESAEWLVVELDRCATDMMQAVEQSVKYLIGEKLGRGR